MGPTALLEKSFLQSLSIDESVLFDRFFIAVISPLFYVETLADLEKAVRQGRTPEQEVGIIARKTPEMNGVPCAHHTELCIANLLGAQIPMQGRVPLIGGRPVMVDGRSGMIFEERPEAEAFRRWQIGEFLEVEHRFAKGWRDALNSLDLMAVAAGMRAMGVNPQSCKTLDDAKQLAIAFVRSKDKSLDRLKFANLTLGLPPESEPFIAEQWEKAGFPSLAEYVPFAAYLLTLELFFQITLAADLISAERASNRQDVGYLSYLPFSMVFVSSDKLHRRIAQYFLRSDQSFVWGPDLKADLQSLVARYLALPQSEQEKGLMKFAAAPPQDSNCLITTLWNHHFGILRAQAAEAALSFDDATVQGDDFEEKRKSTRPFPAGGKELVEYLNRFGDAEGLPRDDVDFDVANPEVLSIKRQVHKRKGSFWQVPKDLKERPN